MDPCHLSLRDAVRQAPCTRAKVGNLARRNAILGRMGWRRLVVAAAFGLLAVGTVFVFLAFDRHSHSASDTLRPFVITMLPVWVVFLLLARRVRRGPTR